MQNKGLRRDVARKSKIYGELKDSCIKYLSDKRCFRKEWILKDTGFEAIADSIRWDYIAQWIEEEQDCELAPLAKSFFLRREIQQTRLSLPGLDDSNKISKEELVAKVPGKFVASGHGKKTVGYASVKFADGALQLARLKIRRSLAKGLSDSSDKLENQIRRVVHA